MIIMLRRKEPWQQYMPGKTIRPVETGVTTKHAKRTVPKVLLFRLRGIRKCRKR
jgi:hypothetical protein